MDCPAGHDVPVDVLAPPMQNPVQYVVETIKQGNPIEGPLSTSISRIGQQIIDTAVKSLETRCPVPLMP